MKNIAVIVLSYFGYKLCLSCIESVLSELDATIFLVDNSEDEHEKEQLIGKYCKYENIQLIFPEENVGFASGVNLALEKAQNEGFNVFFLLNNDAVLLKGSGPSILDAINDNPCTLIAPLICWDGSIRGYNYYHRYLGLIVCKQPQYIIGWQQYFTGCALIFDSSVLKRVGTFNESFFMYGEDVEFCYRATSKGIPLFNINEELVFHKGNESSRMASLFYEYHLIRAHYLLTFSISDTLSKKLIGSVLKPFSLASRALLRSIRYKNVAPILALFVSPFNLTIRPKQK